MSRKTVGAMLAVAAALLAIGWRLGWFAHEDKAIAELRTLAKQPQSKESGKAIRQAFRESTEGMSDDQKFAFFEKAAPIFVPMMAKAFEQRYDAFMKMTPAEQKKELDKAIDDMQKRKPGPGGGGPPRPQISAGKATEMQKKMLDWTTPDQRAKFEDGMRRFNERLQQRGMETVGGPGGGFF